MAYFELNKVESFPFDGQFYTYGVDDTKPPSEQIEEEIILLSVKCDIQESNNTDSNGFLENSFKVFFPFLREDGVNIQRGNKFKGNLFGIQIDGEVLSVYPTQMGICEVKVKDLTL